MDRWGNRSTVCVSDFSTLHCPYLTNGVRFWELTIRNATGISQKRFIESMHEYLEGVVQESIDKKHCRILDINSYIDARRRTSAVKPSFSVYELGLDIPDEVMSHPIMQEMILTVVDLVAFSNVSPIRDSAKLALT